MAAYERASNASLDLLYEQGEEINFFQAIRVLEPLMSSKNNLRFKVINSDAFHPNFIAGVERKHNQDNSHTTVVSVNGFGTTGMQGPIPQCYSELLQRASVRGPSGKEEPHDFLDIFHDRIISLLYEIKKHFNPLLFNEQPEEHFLFTLFASVSGVASLDLFDRLPVNRAQIASYSPVMSNRRVDYSHIINVIKEQLSCDIKVIPNCGSWQQLPETLQAKLSTKSSRLSLQQQSGLGKGISLGNQFWDNQSTIRLEITVPDIETCHQLLPNGDRHNELTALLSFLCDGQYQYLVRLFIPWCAIPDSKLRPSNRLKLGQSAWLHEDENTPEHTQFPEFVIKPNLSKAQPGLKYHTEAA